MAWVDEAYNFVKTSTDLLCGGWDAEGWNGCPVFSEDMVARRGTAPPYLEERAGKQAGSRLLIDKVDIILFT